MSKDKKSDKKPIEQYEHKDKERMNNPPVGLVNPETDIDSGKKTYSYDPHLDPTLQWAGKAERVSFEVPTRSLHVHERIDPRTIIEAVRKKNGKTYEQPSLFSSADENPPLREAIEFYKHKHNWSNRLIAGDSLLVMNSLLEKEGMAGKVQMMFFDPPYGIKYGSNFQPFINNRLVEDGKDSDLTAEPEMIKAFRDTWELGIHSYLTYIRDRLLLTRDLLSKTGSVFVQINDDNLHFIKNILDEIFGKENCVNIIPFKKRASYLSRFGKGLFELFDYIIWYAKDYNELHVNTLFKPAVKADLLSGEYRYYQNEDGSIRSITDDDVINPNLDLSKVFRTHSASKNSKNPKYHDDLIVGGQKLSPPYGHEWKADKEGMQRLIDIGRLRPNSSTRPYKIFYNDFPYSLLNNLWDDTLAEQNPIYAVQTDELPIERCMMLTSHPGDLVMDITCGSGTTAFVAEELGRRWITCDTSRVSIALARQRLMTSEFLYYELAHPKEGIGGGLKYKTAKRINLEILAYNRPPVDEILYDKPIIVPNKTRVAGPFTVEAVPAPAVKSLASIKSDHVADESIARSGETLRINDWKDEIYRTGIRGKGGQRIELARMETLPGTKWLHVDGETKEESPKRIVVSFGPEHAPLEQRQVELAINEAQKLVPKPQLIGFAAFQFDPEAAKDIDETNWPGVTLLKIQMNADLLTDDLKKKRSSNESFWLIGQPDVVIEKFKKGKDDGKYQVSVNGFDYYNTRTGNIESGGSDKIAMWMLDTDYDGRSLFPRQVFFPMAGEKEGWSKLAKNLKAEIDEELIEAYKGTTSIPFEVGNNKRVAVKIIDDRGIESLKIIEVE